MTDTNTIHDKNIDEESIFNVVSEFMDSVQALPFEERKTAKITQLFAECVPCTHALLLKFNPDDATLEYEAAFPSPESKPDIYFPTFNTEDDSISNKLLQGDVISYTDAPNEEALSSFVDFVKGSHVTLAPVQIGEQLIAAIALYNHPDHALDSKRLKIVDGLLPIISVTLEAIFRNSKLNQRIQDVEREAEIFSRIDAELNDTIELDYVFTMMKDWALRFTNADAATLCLYDTTNDTLRLMSDYGLKPNAISLGQELSKEQGGITLRVAHTGNSEIVPDVTSDSDYFALADGIRTQMSVPIKREERVVGVLTLFSKKLTGFTDDHLDFVKRLAGRAGVALDNARLFTQTKREREKLSNILRNIGDNVIVVSLDHRIEMMNASTILAFQLSVEENYIGTNFATAINHSPLQIAYQEAVENNDTVSAEMDLPNGRTYHTSIEHHKGIGRIIVMQDITHFKETDRLKTELVATVSHDLKQPLSVMRGYLDLLRMVNDFDEKSLKYIGNLNFAFNNMQQLIDDLLDIARIEAGIKLEWEDVNLVDVLNRAVRSNTQQADAKQINLKIDLPDTIPILSGDPKRLEQIFNNLISNAIKYTPPEGDVKVYTELNQNALRIFVKDNGMGIGPEDQSQIFERFYRVRRPETDSIEGTGLGLAIVKSLVEAHQGKIDIKSALGEGSTFRVTLPR